MDLQSQSAVITEFCYVNSLCNVRCEVFTAVSMKNAVFCDIKS
jgi:hypothetical protein